MRYPRTAGLLWPLAAPEAQSRPQEYGATLPPESDMVKPLRYSELGKGEAGQAAPAAS